MAITMLGQSPPVLALSQASTIRVGGCCWPYGEQDWFGGLRSPACLFRERGCAD